MVVRIGEVSHEAPTAAPAAAGAPAAAEQASPAELRLQVRAAIAREASRRERLWAD